MDISPTIPLTDTDISPTETYHRQTSKPVTYQAPNLTDLISVAPCPPPPEMSVSEMSMYSAAPDKCPDY